MKNALTAQKALTGFYNVWAPGDEDVELPCVEKTDECTQIFTRLGFFLANPWLALVQSANSATPAAAGRSPMINRNS